jgi:hypothetical protein
MSFHACGNCALKQRVPRKISHRNCLVIDRNLNGVDLLRVIKLICFNNEDEKHVPQKVPEVKSASHALKRGRDSNRVCQTKFLNTVQVMEQLAASLGEDHLAW